MDENVEVIRCNSNDRLHNPFNYITITFIAFISIFALEDDYIPDFEYIHEDLEDDETFMNNWKMRRRRSLSGN